ncbi:efflux RND transporter periplasmic adaptor subunit [Actibacterium sp.]|uniref:efflux RND transporter periplasmic adaptor subunit n=1 Tax=Actibacterium sp. TaxID=1872125 RepID=UPI003568552F
MRIVSFIIAIVVTVTLYLLLMERDTLLEFAGRSPDTEETQDAAQTPDTSADTHPAEANPDAVPVMAMHSSARPVSDLVMVRGRTEAARQVNALSETSGRVVSEPLRKGTFVAAGDVMCKLDPGTREDALDQARAALAAAEINDRAAQSLRKDGYASESRAAATGAAITSARAAVAAAEREIERLTIAAPFAGVLETDSAELGALLQPGALCATVIQLDPIKLVGFLPETEVAKVNSGDQALARLATGANVTGTVSFLGRSADPATRTFRVEVEIPNRDLSIRDGQTVEMVLASGSLEAHLLPQSALTLDDTGALGVRIIDTGDMAKFIPVTALRDTAEGIWVSGLPSEADVITIGQEYVIDGVQVRASFGEATQ